MIGPRSTTLNQPMTAFDMIPGIVGDSIGAVIPPPINPARLERFVCVISKRVVFAEEDTRDVGLRSSRARVMAPESDRAIESTASSRASRTTISGDRQAEAADTSRASKVEDDRSTKITRKPRSAAPSEGDRSAGVDSTRSAKLPDEEEC